MKQCILPAILASLVVLQVPLAHADAYDPPAGYYANATGTGATLKAQLTTIMAAGHIQRTYGDFRSSAAITDRDPVIPNNILLVYNRASVSSTWNSGVTWNREHVWPQSLQPGSASNSVQGNLGDPHAVRPANPGINSDRGNKPFGLVATTGAHRNLGTYYFPGDTDKGDIARSLFYSATRWSSLGLTLVNGTPGSNQMGDLQALIKWHYLDPPDEFERRRNHAIYSQDLNPQYHTNNRNAFVDRPEFVWSVFGSFDNDSTLYLGESPTADGSSTMPIDFGRVLVGTAFNAEQSLTLLKSGTAPTFYEVQVDGEATASKLGRFNAFAFDPQSASLTVSLTDSIASAGVKSGTVTIDNLDPSSAAAGQGAADGNDQIFLQVAVLNPAQPSFTAGEHSTSTTAAWTVATNSGVHEFAACIHNADYNTDQALLDIDSVTGVAAPFSLISPLPNGIGATPATLTFTFDTTSQPVGLHTAAIDIIVSDENIPGETSSVLNLELEVNVTSATGDADGDGDIDVDDWAVLADCLTGPHPTASTACQVVFDFDADADVDLRDLATFQAMVTGS